MASAILSQLTGLQAGQNALVTVIRARYTTQVRDGTTTNTCFFVRDEQLPVHVSFLDTEQRHASFLKIEQHPIHVSVLEIDNYMLLF